MNRDHPNILYDIAAGLEKAMEGGDPETAAEVRRIAAELVVTADNLLAALDEYENDDEDAE